MRAATLLVTPDQASKVELARNQGKVSLVLRNPLDRTLPETESATAESLDPLIFAGANKALRAGIRTAVPNVRDDKVWAQITNPDGSTAKPEKKEAPKPRYIIDVYHGDKHVQELFQ
ncbi:MAG: hypothetical protein H7Y20_19610 [Bryobacteraceae bacterium]|nr:hypothetical protein [Bryobacteraceae bacterium]